MRRPRVKEWRLTEWGYVALVSDGEQALKFLLPETATEDDALARFERETRENFGPLAVRFTGLLKDAAQAPAAPLEGTFAQLVGTPVPADPVTQAVILRDVQRMLDALSVRIGAVIDPVLPRR